MLTESQSRKVPERHVPAGSAAPHRRPLVRRLVWVVAGLYWIVLFILTHIPAPQMPSVQVSDKLAHFLAYSILAALLYGSIRLANPARRGIGGIVIVIGLVYGAVDELLQIPVGRSCELGDWLANAAGVMSTVGIIALFRRIRRQRL